MEPLSLQGVAAIAGMEATYFSTFFHKKMGLRFWDWLTRYRIEKAKVAIASDDRSITNIALSVGFGDITSFERAFKKIVGLTAIEYRKRVRPS